MKPPSESHELIRWLDGEMTEAERASFEGQLKQDPVLAKDAEEFRALSASLRAHLPAEMRVPHEDFFNSQIQVRIAQRENEASLSGRVSSASWLTWFRQPWFAVAGAAAVVAFGFLALRNTENTTDSLILSSYTPNTAVMARTYHDVSAQATVLMLDGLEEVPSDRKVSGLNVHHSESEPEIASTTLYDTSGALLLMISRDSTGNPYFRTVPPRS